MLSIPFSLRFAAVVGFSLAFSPAVFAAPLPNAMCPVMPDEKAVPEFKAEHNGRTIHFCCTGCVQKFKANPGPYLSQLPPVASPGVEDDPARNAPQRANPREKSSWERLEPVFNVIDFCQQHLPLLIYVSVVGLVFLVASRVRCRLGKCETPGRVHKLLRPCTQRSTLVILVLLGVIGEFWRDNVRTAAEAERVKKAAEEEMALLRQARNEETARSKTSTKLLSWEWPSGLHELPKGLKNTYYRGNDERSPKLFNGGNYRTVTFHVAARNGDRDLTPGMNLASRTSTVRLEIVRAPNTTPHFFKAKEMAQTFLLPLEGKNEGENEGKTPKPTLLTTVTPEWRWAAEVSFEQVIPATGYIRLNGVWVLCVGDPNHTTAATIHYYIQCILHVQDGVVLPQSRIWMIPVYPSPILHGPNADAEWYSDRPIPEIPDGKNVTDPKLLGLPEEKKP